MIGTTIKTLKKPIIIKIKGFHYPLLIDENQTIDENYLDEYIKITHNKDKTVAILPKKDITLITNNTETIQTIIEIYIQETKK